MNRIRNFLLKIIYKDKKAIKAFEKKIYESKKNYWSHLRKNLDVHSEKYIKNENCPTSTYEETALTKQANMNIEQNLEKIRSNHELRKETDGQYIKINIIFLTIFGYSTSINFTDSLFLFSILFIMALYMCYSWYKDVESLYIQNIAYFSIIRELQNKYLPFKPHGDADIKIIHEINGGKKHTPGPLHSMKRARFFAFLYCLIFIFYILNQIITNTHLLG